METINTLIDILGREASLLETFLELLEEQKQALVDNDVERLNSITAQQREKMQESNLLNCEREDAIARIKEANELEGDVTVSRLLEIVAQPQADQLKRVRDGILAINERILKTRNQNALLLNKSREYIQRTMEMLSRMGRGETTYSPVAVSGGQANVVAVDRRV